MNYKLPKLTIGFILFVRKFVVSFRKVKGCNVWI